MSKKDEPVRPEARLPKGLFDTPASELRATADMLATIRGVFEGPGLVRGEWSLTCPEKDTAAL